MLFRVENDKLIELEIEVENEDAFLEKNKNSPIKFIKVELSELPENPYPTHAYYKYDESGNIVLDTDRMLEHYKQFVIDKVNERRNQLIDQGFQWTDPTTNKTYTFGLSNFDKEGFQTLAISVLLGQTENLFFITKDNETVPLTPDTAKSLCLTASNYASSIVYQARQIKDQILSATTLDEAVNIVVQNLTTTSQSS